MSEFIIAIREHSNIGFVPTAYEIELQPNTEFYIIKGSVTLSQTKAYANNFSEEESELVQLIDEYSDAKLMRKFAQKKAKITNPNQFFKSIDKEIFDNQIRPYVERRVVRIIDLLNDSGIRLFHKMDNKHANIYFSDEIVVEKQAAETVFNIHRGRDFTKYYLSIFHKNKDISLNNKFGIIISNEPCRLILNKQLFHFDDIDGKKLEPFFRKQFVAIQQRTEKKWFKLFAQAALKKYRVNSSGFEIKNLKPEKKARITLKKNWANEITFVLQFFYGERAFYPNYKDKHLVFFIEKETSFYFEKLSHDVEWENNCLIKIKNIGLVKENSGDFTINTFSDDVDLQNYEIINWINENIYKFTENGFEVIQEIEESNFYLGKFKLQMKVKDTEKDWFDIYAVISFDEFDIPFIKFKKHILKGNREFKLPNGKLFILPEEWFAQYKELLQHAEEDGKRLKLKSHHFNLISEKVIETDNKYLKSLKELTNFNLPKNIEIPASINAELRTYQKEGFHWMQLLQNNNFGGCLADDMGLGKTLQTLTLLSTIYSGERKEYRKAEKAGQLNIFPSSEAENKKEEKASLITMPVSLIINWENEIKKFNPSLKVLKFGGAGRTKNIEDFCNYDIILSSYGIIRNESVMLKNYDFHYIILDESQNIKNSQSKTYKALLELNSRHKLVLTGTPIENSLTDLWSQMNFVNNGLLGNFNFFVKEYVKPIEKQHDEKQQEKLKLLIKPFILRRTKDKVAKDLPPVTEQVLYCDMAQAQSDFYVEEKSKIRNQILENIEKQGIAKTSFLAIQGLTRLRQIANHSILADAEKDLESGKFEMVKNKLETLMAEGHKVLIFSSFVKHLNLFEQHFTTQNWKYSLLTGSLSKEKRQKAIENFQNDKETQLFLISIKAGGVGLNLTSADYVFILDPWWNPATEVQAVNRAHRIGQDKNVFVYRFISNKTVEKKIRKLQEEKSALAETFINSNNPFKNFDKEKIMDFFE